MPIHVKGKSCRSVTQIPLNGLHIVPVLERQYRVSMAQIMDFGVGRADLQSDLLEMVIDRLRLKRRSEERREGQGGPMLCLRLPALPGNGGLFPLSDLLLIALLHQLHDVRSRFQDAALPVFGGSKDNAAVFLSVLLICVSF